MGNVNLLYTDLDPQLNMSWDKDVQKSSGFRAVKNSILGIILTKKGSRPFDPEFGCDLSDQIFENMSPLVIDTVEKNILTGIRNYEPRVNRLKVNVTPLYDSNSIIVEIFFSIVDNPDVLEQIKIQLASN